MKNLSHLSLRFKIFCSIVFFYFLFSIFYLSPVLAQSSIKSTNYEITWPNLNMGSGKPDPSNFKLGVTTGQTSPGLYSSTGYKVRSGFQYIHSIIPFSFSISDLSIALGTLTPETPVTQTNTLTVSAGGAGGYQVTARENEPLSATGGSTTIPDTSCNGGADTCDETTAKPWTDNSKYGFGYNMSGNDVPSTFVNSTYYRPFPSLAASENAAVVMSSSVVGESRQATVTYKVNISNVQAAGSYENIIIFVATPSF
jgi:hypothetical protein